MAMKLAPSKENLVGLSKEGILAHLVKCLVMLIGLKMLDSMPESTRINMTWLIQIALWMWQLSIITFAKQ